MRKFSQKFIGYLLGEGRSNKIVKQKTSRLLFVEEEPGPYPIRIQFRFLISQKSKKKTVATNLFLPK